MERILLSHDKRGFDKALKLINADLAIYNNLVEVINENTDKFAVNKENIQTLLADPKGFLFDLIVDKSHMSFNGLPINKRKAIELIDFPKELNIIISEFQSAKTELSKVGHEINSDVIIDRLSLANIEIVADRFVLTTAYLSELESEFSSYTRNENQNEAFKLMQQFDNIIDRLLKIGIIKPGQDLEDMKLKDLGFSFYDRKRSIDLSQIRRVR